VYVSIVIPAYNAAATLAETLESIRSQTSREWEAIVVDDGSSDATAVIASSFGPQDSRIRVVSRPHEGVSAARNAGIALARFDWLLFVDADDWLVPEYLERMTRELASNPNLDAVHCRWSRVAPDGTLCGGDQFSEEVGDLFDLFACTCVFAVHACIVRRSLVVDVGGFDISLRICEDWDLWQRIARTGACFGAVQEVLALYRMRPASASVDGVRFLSDGLRVIARGHAPDPRVPNPHPAHASGRSASHIDTVKFSLACWTAGLMLGNGEDATPLLESLREARDPAFDPHEFAESVFQAAPLPACRLPGGWIELWPAIEPLLEKFLTALESQTLAPKLARRARKLLEQLVLENATAGWPLALGTTYAVRVEITAPIEDIHPPASADSVQCAIDCEGAYLDTVYLPVCDGLVSGAVIADAIAAESAWEILGRFFERTVYRKLHVERLPDGVSIRRGTLPLGERLSAYQDERKFWSEAHDRIGWVVFLQEIWGRPEWPDGRFYNPPEEKEPAPRCSSEDGWLIAEVSEDPASVETFRSELKVILTVGGVAVGVVTVTVKENAVHADDLRAALNDASGYELCRAVVREALLGQPFGTGESLRSRLAAAAARRRKRLAAPIFAGLAKINGFTTVPAVTTIAENALLGAVAWGEPALVLGRRIPETFGTCASRRAMLPAAAARELLETASIAGEPAILLPPGDNKPERVVYAPDFICHSDRGAPAFTTTSPPSRAGESKQDESPLRYYFECLFAAGPDPWKYTSPYEQIKYEQTLELLPPGRPQRALELACAEGHFTRQLALRVGSLLAADIAQVAVDRAAQRCADLKNVRFTRLDIMRDSLPGPFDLIVCSEVFYYFESLPAARRIAEKLAAALEPGGYLVAAHANLVVDEPERPGFDWDCPFGAKVIGEILADTPGLRLVKELRTPFYRIELLQRARRSWLNPGLIRPKVIEIAEPPAPLPEHVAPNFLWQGGTPLRKNPRPAVVTDRLPILMYHRVAPTGASAMSAYRVTPEKFGEQLRSLRDSGYYSVGLEDWRAAAARRTPLPGKAVLITFDDGYRDFFTHAWPLLKSYGFSATVFLVADEIGKSNSWDRAFGEEVPLLGWPEIRQLQSEGVEFGSHSATHSPLTGLSPADIVHEAARSRAILQRELKVPIQAFAYPYGDVDPVVRHLIGACGYIFGLTCQPGLSELRDSLMTLPRIEVTGSAGLTEFVGLLD
jgi:peptidoglycan/xylan/chitin deacetylase (PgdA/CDA1 family)/SAM-dependent methyltransferase